MSSKALKRDAITYLGYAEIRVDAFCIYCEKDSVFSRPKGQIPEHWDYYWEKTNNISTNFACSRNDAHKFLCEFIVLESSIIKYGQYPSVADMSVNELNRFRKTLGEKFSELKRATGLSSHGISVGAILYLRRVYEFILEKHRVTYESENGKIDNYDHKRVSEKIVLLKDSLPNFLVDNKIIYDHLSKGVHELTEEECAKFFPILFESIIMILDQDLAAQEQRDRQNSLKKALSDINQS